jgi:hypothetical protein
MSYKPPIGAATASTRGILKLAGDLGGTADVPTVSNMAKAAYGGLETVSTNSTATGTVTLNLTNGNVFNLTLTGNVTLVFSGATSGKACSFATYLKQDATGSRVVTWPASSVKWSGGSPPSLSSAPNSVDVVVFESLDGGTTWYGSLVGTAFS